MSFQGQLQIMSLKEKALLLLLRSLFQLLRTELRTKLLLIVPLRVVLSIRRKKMMEKSLMLRPLKKFLIFSLHLFVLGKMNRQLLLNFIMNSSQLVSLKLTKMHQSWICPLRGLSMLLLSSLNRWNVRQGMSYPSIHMQICLQPPHLVLCNLMTWTLICSVD